VVDAGVSKPMDLQVVVPLEDMSQLGQVVTEPAGPGPGSSLTTQRQSIWPAIHPRLLDLVLAHRSTILFVNARRLAERLAAALNELHAARVRLDLVRAAGYDPVALGVSDHPDALADPDLPDEVIEALTTPVDDLVLAHHGSLSKERRALIEDQLKAGTLRGLVATSSLELGIDMGAVDLVVQVASPGSVSRGLQRIGRAGHQVGEPARGGCSPSTAPTCWRRPSSRRAHA
jgi:ATP-dependent helicase Lhr and Lhr-like helicase